MNCVVPRYLAYAMTMYICASIFYIIRTRSIGTPFNDSLTDKQKLIKKEASEIRSYIFGQGILFSLALLIYVKPFKTC